MNICYDRMEPADLELRVVFEGEKTLHDDYELRPHAGKAGETTFYYGRRGEASWAATGLGHVTQLSLDSIRMAAGSCVRAIKRERFAVVTLSVAGLEEKLAGSGISLELWTAAWVEGWLLGNYSFEMYKQSVELSSLRSLQLLGGPSSIGMIVEQASARAEGVALARDLCNEPANVMNPEALVERVKVHFAGSAVAVECWHGEELERKGMNGLLAIGKGSSYKPAMLKITYMPDGPIVSKSPNASNGSDVTNASNPGIPHFVLIGKGITFDMGGMNVKNAKDLSEARYDMGGACAVLGVMHMLARLGLMANVTALIPVSDNVPDGSSIVPSTIIQYPNGLTVQVGNTDAEGRLVIADALLYAGGLGASEVIDIATLTGNVGQALGLRMAGVWGDDDGAMLLRRIGEHCGDRVWPMPLVDDDEEQLKSDYADLNNISASPYGGAIAAALFLRRFVPPSLRWLHIDMANTVQSAAPRGYYTAGATGYGARLLFDYMTERVMQR